MNWMGVAAFLLAPAQDADPRPPSPDPVVQKVSELVRARASSLIDHAAAPRTTLDEALAQAAKMDDALLEEVSRKLSLIPERVREAWLKRDRKSKKASFGNGSWIVLGGQDGGLDSSVKGTPAPVENLIPPGPSILTRQKPPPPPEPLPLGKALKTKAEWWTSASPGERSALVEAEYARKSALLEKKEETKKCATCSGKGTVATTRAGVALIVVCGRCHGVKEDLVLVYE